MSVVGLDHTHQIFINSSNNVFFYFIFRQSKEEYDKEMSRRLLFEGETGATSSSDTDKTIKASGDSQITTLAPSQQSNPSKPAFGNS